MPIYEYRCRECSHQFEHLQRFSEANLIECPACKGRLDKVIHTPSIVFKGTGFYKTDSRSASSTNSPPAKKD